MDYVSNLIKTSFALGGSFVSFLFGSYDSLLLIFTVMVIIDYVTGLIASGIEGKLSSLVGFKGIAKKVMIFSIVAVAHFIDQLVGNSHLIRDATIFFYMVNEILSIIENAGRSGIPVPDFLKKAIDLLKNRTKTK